MTEKYPSFGPVNVKASGGSRKRPDQPCSSSSLQSKRSRENSDIDVPPSSDPVNQVQSVSSLVASPGPIPDPFIPDIKPQNVSPHSTIDEMKSPTPMTSGLKLEVSNLKSTLETMDQKPILTSPTQPDPFYATIPEKEFTHEELEAGLRPIFTLIWEHPEAYPFREPINPQRLGIPEYFNIVKYPMDLDTIDRKLVNGEYKNPWEFCNDMWLMFDNAWLYNKETSKVYKMCTKLYEVFSEHVDNTMKSFGYSCGSRNLALSQTGKQSTEESSAAGLPVSAPGGQTNSVGGHDQKKTKLIQQQLVLLLHTNKCLQREGENPAHTCNLRYCHTMKDVLRHMMTCQESNNCSYSHCVSSRRIIMHWKQCGRHDCTICTPVKGVITPGSVPVDGSLAAGPQGGNAWQSSIQQNLRDHLIRRMLHGIYPVQNIEAMRQNTQYIKLVAYFKKIEEDFFNSCSSKEEYFSKLAEKYRHVQAEISRTPRHVPAGPHSMIPSQSYPPFNQETANPSAGSYPSSSTMMDCNSSMPLSSYPINQVPRVSSLMAPPGPISDPFTSNIKKPILTSPTQPGPLFNATIPKPNPSTLSQTPLITSPPLTTLREPTQPVSVAPVSTPVEEGAPSTKVVPNPQLKKEFTREELEGGLRPSSGMIKGPGGEILTKIGEGVSEHGGEVIEKLKIKKSDEKD